MSLTTTVNKITHTGNGSTTNFTWNFLISASSDLKVYVDGVLQTSGYSISSGLGSASGGTVAFTSAPANNAKVQIVRTVALTQATDYVENEKFPANTHETALDKLTMMSQQLSETIDRSPTLAIDTTATLPAVFPAPTASTLIQWNSAGNALENSAAVIGSLATQSASSVNIDGGNIDGTVIGAASAAAATVTTLTATTSNLGTLGAAVNANNVDITNIDIDSGAIDGTVIGGSSAAAGSFTTIAASGAITGSSTIQGTTATATTKVVTPEVEMSGSTLLVDAASGTLDMNATTLDVDATTTCEIDNTNTTNGVKVGTNTSGGKVYLGHTTSETTVNDNLTVTGDLIVNGTTTTVNSTTITVDDKNLEIGSVASPSDSTADGGGITLKGATDKTLIWDNANDNWTSNQHLNISTGKEFKINNTKVLDATSLGSAVVGTSITSTGTIASGTWQGTAVAPQYGGTGQNFSSSTGAIQVSSGTVSAGTLPVSMGGSGQTSYTNGQLLIGNTTGNTLAKGTLTAGTGISVTNAGGSITIANTGNAAQADMNGSELVLDTDGDTSITADTDDQIDIKISGADDFQFTANTFTVLSGSTLTIASGATIANSGTATNFDDGTAAAMALALGG